MKVFILEDNPERMTAFSAIWIQDEMVATNSVRQARKILENEKFDHIMLDHDLGGEVYVDSADKNTGTYLCKHMHETVNADTPITIHSWNDIGAERMVNYLLDNNHCGKIEKIKFGSIAFNEKVQQLMCEQDKEKRAIGK